MLKNIESIWKLTKKYENTNLVLESNYDFILLTFRYIHG